MQWVSSCPNASPRSKILITKPTHRGQSLIISASPPKGEQSLPKSGQAKICTSTEFYFFDASDLILSLSYPTYLYRLIWSHLCLVKPDHGAPFSLLSGGNFNEHSLSQFANRRMVIQGGENGIKMTINVDDIAQPGDDVNDAGCWQSWSIVAVSSWKCCAVSSEFVSICCKVCLYLSVCADDNNSLL